VQEVSAGPSRNGAFQVAHVTLNSRSILVSVPPNTCAAGDSIKLQGQRRLWGYAISTDPMGCSTPGR
jgi:hypothetical protein